MKTIKPKPLAVSFLALLFAFATGAVMTASAEDKKPTVNASDAKFIKMAGDHGMAEVKISTLGTLKAERADVKELATMLMADHTKSNAELTSLAEAKGVSLSAVIDSKAADTFRDLENESGKDFDKEFLDHMEKAHKDLIASFEDAEKDAADSELKAWISKTLPTLRSDLDKVKELKSK